LERAWPGRRAKNEGWQAMLKGLDPLLDADLLSVLAAMGHGDEIALVDANFPAASVAERLVRSNGASLAEVARAVLSVLPLDTYVETPLVRMEVVGDPVTVPEVQREVIALVQAAEGAPVAVGSLERFAFYERARHAYAVVATGERRAYGCVLLSKGVLVD